MSNKTLKLLILIELVSSRCVWNRWNGGHIGFHTGSFIYRMHKCGLVNGHRGPSTILFLSGKWVHLNHLRILYWKRCAHLVQTIPVTLTNCVSCGLAHLLFTRRDKAIESRRETGTKRKKYFLPSIWTYMLYRHWWMLTLISYRENNNCVM